MISNKNIELVIFDFDDTLCMTEEACWYLENEVAASMGHEPMTRATHQRNWGKPLKDAITERIPGINASVFINKIELFAQNYIQEGRLDVISEETWALLDDLKYKGKKLAILTNRDTSELAHLLEPRHPINQVFQHIYHRDNLHFHKPDPRTFWQVLDDFRMEAQKACYLGDTVTDAIAAKGAGLHFIAVLENGIRKQSDFVDIEVDFFAARLAKANEYLK